MKFRRQRREEDLINLTPLIDVVFMLLIFFMVSTSFTRETHLKVELPEATGEQSSDSIDRLEIFIGADGSYAIGDKLLINNQMETLKEALKKVSGGDTKMPLTITADAKTPHQAVVQAMDAAGQLGFVHLSITTREPGAE